MIRLAIEEMWWEILPRPGFGAIAVVEIFDGEPFGNVCMQCHFPAFDSSV